MNQNAAQHFFISYNKADRSWAEWIAWQLEGAGYSTIIQAWDFQPGMSFVHKMHEAVQEAERTIAVLSTNYLAALYTYSEWEVAFKQDPRGEKGVLVPVRIQACKPPGLLGLLSYIDLVGLDETAAQQTLLDGVRQGCNKPPTAPLFPGSLNEAQRSITQQPSFPGAVPSIELTENVPYPRNPYFTGRDTILHDLHEALNNDSATAITQGQAIFGLGGIGKTQTAVEYTYRYRSEYRYIFWIRAETEVELQTGFVAIAKLLNLPEQNATNPTDTAQAVKRWLERTSDWLLVFDNADTPELLTAYYPHTPRGHILLTSRAQNFDTLGIDSTYALQKLDPGEAHDFLSNRTARTQTDPQEKHAIEQLARELGYLPLALGQAAAYIRAKGARFQDYLASYQRQRLSLLNKANPKTGNYPSSVAKTWALNFQEVEKDPVAADILRVSAFLSSDAIPLELLTEGASQLGPVLAESLASEDPLALNEALEPLTRYSLIRLDVETQTYSIHRMVQEVLKDQMGAEVQAEWAECVVQGVEQSSSTNVQQQNQHQSQSDTQSYVLAFDIGTSSVRALLFDSSGIAVPNVLAQHSYPLNTTTDGEVSVDADMLVDLVAQSIDEVLTAAGPLAAHIKAVATATFWHTLLGVDASGRPVMPLLTWEDTRPASAAAELRTLLDEDAIHKRNGARIHASYWPAKLRWLSTAHPELFNQTAQWLSFGEYLHRRFLGRSVCSLSMASGTGMLVLKTHVWDSQLQEVLGVRDGQLPQLGDLQDSISGLKPEFAARWPALQGVPWFPAIGDGAAANVGSGCATEENWAITIGTSSAIRVIVSPDVVPAGGLWLYLLDHNRGLLGGALSEGGNIFAWLEATLKLPPLAEADSLIAALQPDGHGLTILPMLAGERSPGWHSNASMTITGINSHTSPILLLRASLESLAYQLSEVYDQLITALEEREIAPTLIGSGGAMLGSITLQGIVADTLNAPFYPLLQHEASARGAALPAFEALGIIHDIAHVPVDLEAPVLPDEARHAIYAAAANRQRNLYHLLLGE